MMEHMGKTSCEDRTKSVLSMLYQFRMRFTCHLNSLLVYMHIWEQLLLYSLFRFYNRQVSVLSSPAVSEDGVGVNNVPPSPL